MGVYFKDMYKPGSCDECPLYCCPHNFADCPAVAVPAHGRLIDADELLSKDRLIYRSDGAAIGARRYIDFSEIEDAPTIIPAEEGE